MSRIEPRFAALKREGRAGLVTFITAGDPDEATSLKLLKALPSAGHTHRRHHAASMPGATRLAVAPRARLEV